MHKTFYKTGKTKKRISPAKFSKETKLKILERDVVCIICGNQGTDCHHVFFSQESNYGENRNDLDQGVLLCRLCHVKCHGCKSGDGVRQECINYLDSTYNK